MKPNEHCIFKIKKGVSINYKINKDIVLTFDTDEGIIVLLFNKDRFEDFIDVLKVFFTNPKEVI